jgi:hypothetical protein
MSKAVAGLMLGEEGMIGLIDEHGQHIGWDGDEICDQPGMGVAC